MSEVIANSSGAIRSYCPDCQAKSSFSRWSPDGSGAGTTSKVYEVSAGRHRRDKMCLTSALYRCVACERGAYAEWIHPAGTSWCEGRLHYFSPPETIRASVPTSVPEGIVSEFREAELCASVGAYRAAGALLRSVLEKTLKASGYRSGGLKKRIQNACDEKVITEVRKNRAEETVYVLGNDILHEDYRVVDEQLFREAHHYCERILEDFYDDREQTLRTLARAGRTADDVAKGVGEEDHSSVES